jgi:hypothetical protein
MRRPDRAPLFAIASLVVALVAAVAVTRSPTPGAPSPSVDPGRMIVGVVPAADPMPWTSVTWRRLVLAPGMPPGHARIDGLVRGAPGLWRGAGRRCPAGTSSTTRAPRPSGGDR